MIELVKNKSNVKFVTPLGAGEDGGYYIPSIDEEGTLTWVASKPDMPAIEPVNIKGADGKDAEVPAFIIGDVDLVDNSKDVYIEAIQDYLNKEVTFNFQFPEGVKVGAATGVEGAEIFNDYKNNQATGKYSNASGYGCIATGDYSLAEGFVTLAKGGVSHSEGSQTEATGDFSHAEGSGSIASGMYSHAEGQDTEASGKHSHSEGNNTKAKNAAAHAEGANTKANGSGSHAEGGYTEASGMYDHAEGCNTVAKGYSSHAEGGYTKTKASYSHAEGNGTIATAEAQHVQGKYNIEDTEKKYAHIVGNGDVLKRSNAHTVDWNGNGWFAGTITIGADNKEVATKEDLANIDTGLDLEITPEDEGKFLMIQGGAVAMVAIPNITEEVF